MVENLVRRILYVDRYDEYKGELIPLHANRFRKEIERISDNHAVFDSTFRKALNARFGHYDFLITDLSFGEMYSILGPNISVGTYLAELAKERNPGIVTIVATGASKIRPNEQEAFDKVFHWGSAMGRKGYQNIANWIIGRG